MLDQKVFSISDIFYPKFDGCDFPSKSSFYFDKDVGISIICSKRNDPSLWGGGNLIL